MQAVLETYFEFPPVATVCPPLAAGSLARAPLLDEARAEQMFGDGRGTHVNDTRSIAFFTHYPPFVRLRLPDLTNATEASRYQRLLRETTPYQRMHGATGTVRKSMALGERR